MQASTTASSVSLATPSICPPFRQPKLPTISGEPRKPAGCELGLLTLLLKVHTVLTAPTSSRSTHPVILIDQQYGHTATTAMAGEHDAVELLTHYIRDALLLKAGGKDAYTYHQCVSLLQSTSCRLSSPCLVHDTCLHTSVRPSSASRCSRWAVQPFCTLSSVIASA